MAVGVLHGLDIAHDGLGEIGQVPAAEEREGQLAQTLGDLDALVTALLVEDAVAVVVLLPVRGKEQHKKGHEPSRNRKDGGQIRTRRKTVDETCHSQEQKAHASHGDQIGDRGPKDAALDPCNALVGQEVLLFK